MKSFQHVKLILLSIVGVLSFSGLVHGHTFTPNEDSSFLSLMDDLKSIILSIRANGDNVTLVTEYTNDASLLLNSSTMKEINEKNQRLGTTLSSSITELQNASGGIGEDEAIMIKDTIDEIISVRIDKSDLENATIQSLAISLDLNKIIEYYSKAYYTTSTKMNRSGHSMMKELHSQNSSSTSNLTSSHSNNTINDIRFYYRGLSLANVTAERFNTEVKDNLIPEDIEFLNTAFIDLRTRLNEKSAINEISGIIHGQIQPTLQRVFKLVLE
jgi:hypothetical protein